MGDRWKLLSIHCVCVGLVVAVFGDHRRAARAISKLISFRFSHLVAHDSKLEMLQLTRSDLGPTTAACTFFEISRY